MKILPKVAVKLIDEKNYAHLGTLMPDGAPHVTAVWIDHQDDFILINCSEETQKVKNIRRDPRVAVSIANSHNSEYAVFIRGRVVEIITIDDITKAHIDKMAKKYTDADIYTGPRVKNRRILKIKPTRVIVIEPDQ